jgi:CRISPR/Cas system-associated exonuclease Cas4 (RecB family)
MRIFEHKQIELEELETEEGNGKRLYVTPDGKFPSITTVLGVLSRQGILEWRKRVGEAEANRISTQAARRGTNVHTMCEDYLNNELTEKNFLPHERLLFRPIKKALDKSIGTVYAQEAPLWSNYLGVAGRVDCIAEWDGRLSIIDFKTSRKLKKKEWIHSYFQQATAYAIMWEERTGIPIDKLVIVITVDDEDEAQVFVEKRDNWVSDLKDTIETYHKLN